jgi:hypothetical protein
MQLPDTFQAAVVQLLAEDLPCLFSLARASCELHGLVKNVQLDSIRVYVKQQQ